jgi:hypothetical protein
MQGGQQPPMPRGVDALGQLSVDEVGPGVLTTLTKNGEDDCFGDDHVCSF